jgi:hypothetical protein
VFRLNMYTVHLEPLGIIHDFQCIAETVNFETVKIVIISTPTIAITTGKI